MRLHPKVRSFGRLSCFRGGAVVLGHPNWDSNFGERPVQTVLDPFSAWLSPSSSGPYDGVRIFRVLQPGRTDPFEGHGHHDMEACRQPYI